VGSGTGTFTVNAPSASGALSTTGTVSVNVLNHSLASFASGDSAALSLNLGTYESGTWTSGAGSLGYSIWNIASGGFTNAQTAGLSLYDVIFTSGADVFSTGWSSFANLASGTSNGFTASVLSPGTLAQGNYEGVYTLRFRDQQDLSGAINTRDLTLTLSVEVVPEPETLALAGFGVAAGASAVRRRAQRRRG
jgi:hypothetical protein